MKKKKANKFAIGIVLAVALLLGAIFYWSAADKTVSDHPAFSRTHPVIFGPEEARVTIMEYFDPACEGCRAFYPAVKQILRDSGGKAKLQLRYATFHRGSDEVVKMLEAARLQGRYWQALEATLARQPQWASHANPQPQLVWDYLGSVGVDVTKAKSDANSEAIQNILEQDEADLVALRIAQTPTFFVNGKPLQDFSEEGLRALVNREIAAAYEQ